MAPGGGAGGGDGCELTRISEGGGWICRLAVSALLVLKLHRRTKLLHL